MKNLILFVFFFVLSINSYPFFNHEEYKYRINPHLNTSFKKNDNSLEKFISALKRKNCPTSFIEESLPFLRKIVFKPMPDNISAYYNRLTRTLYFSKEMQCQESGELKTLDELEADQLKTIFHEFWHVYFYTIAKPRNLPIYKIWKKQAETLYSFKGGKIHDEAYALFVETILGQYILVRSYFEKSQDEEKRNYLRNSRLMKNIYEEIFYKKIFGYYVKWPRIFVYSKINLPYKDRINILENLFEGKIKENYYDAYLEEQFF